MGGGSSRGGWAPQTPTGPPSSLISLDDNMDYATLMPSLTGDTVHLMEDDDVIMTSQGASRYTVSYTAM